MGDYNIEVLPKWDAVNEHPCEERTFHAFPVPFSVCGVVCRQKGAYGLARGMAVDSDPNNCFLCGARNNPRNMVFHALFDATGSGVFDDYEPDWVEKIIKLSPHRRTNLASSLMLMPSYFYAARHRRHYEEWGRRGGVNEYSHHFLIDATELHISHDWSIDPEHPYYTPYGVGEFDQEVYTGRVVILAYPDTTYMGSRVTFVGNFRLKLSDMEGYTSWHDEHVWALAIWNMPSDDNILAAVAKDLNSFSSDPIPIREHPSDDEICLQYLNDEDFSSIGSDSVGRPSYAFDFEYGKVDPIVSASYRICDMTPFESHAVSRSEFEHGFNYIEDHSNDQPPGGLSTGTARFAPWYKWYLHLFDPEPALSWSRDVRPSAGT